MSKWRSVTSDVLRGSVLGTALFNFFVSDIDFGTKCTFSTFAGDTKLCGMVNTLKGRDAIQKDLDMLKRWASVNLRKSNMVTYKVLHIGQGNSKYKYREWTESSSEEKDLQV
ncbi:rna-directed dna polymerase from mobile element jockey-like [Willisornis vidua]|uniref:Rna-directed dna polymerase from mobile element jockey-like n=1 Tax=Willisornis vidua TaxID=1566151 RepID=A0ABQ9D9Y3_9PASS|nr:rna-directed dna polymerase from mobile element jockey-like [Willisornis vidua]